MTRSVPGDAVGKHFRGSIEVVAEADAVAELRELDILNSGRPQVRIAMRIFDTRGLPAVGVRVELTDEQGLRYSAILPTEEPRFLQRFRVPEGRYSVLLSRPGDVNVTRKISVRSSDDGDTFDLRFTP